MKKVFTSCLLASLILALSSCGTTGGVNTKYFDPEMSKEELKAKKEELKEKYANKSIAEQIKDGTLLPPESGCIVFGSGLESVKLIQQNPKIGYRIISTECDYSSGFLGAGAYRYYGSAPLPVGSEIKVFQGVLTEPRMVTYVEFGIAGVDQKLTKPGLYYLPYKDDEGKKEKKALKYIKGLYKGTEWESVIDARIKELKNED